MFILGVLFRCIRRRQKGIFCARDFSMYKLSFLPGRLARWDLKPAVEVLSIYSENLAETEEVHEVR